MQPLLFKLDGVLVTGKYIPGQYAWRYPVTLQGATLTVRPATAGPTTITLEVGGELTDLSFTVPLSTDLEDGVTPETKLELALNLAVDAGDTVRWLVTDAPDPAVFPAGAATFAAVIVQASASSTAQVSVPLPVLGVYYVAGSFRALVFSYNSLTHGFLGTGEDVGLCAITDDGTTLSISIGGVEALRVQAQTIFCNIFFALGSTATGESPRLEFWVDILRVATLGASGTLKVANIIEEMPESLTPDDAGFYSRFEFWSGGILTAALGSAGLIASSVTEPISHG